MSDAVKEKQVGAEDKADWLELIEDHLKAVRRGQIVIIILLLLLLITMIATYLQWVALLHLTAAW